jgi:hypothetical protein
MGSFLGMLIFLLSLLWDGISPRVRPLPRLSRFSHSVD